MKNYIYILYREKIGNYYQGISPKGFPVYMYEGQLKFNHFNLAITFKRTFLSLIFDRKVWYESSHDTLFKQVSQTQLKTFPVFYFNWFTIHVARIFAWFMLGNLYKIHKVKVI